MKIFRIRRHGYLAGALLALIASLSACGQYGDLYLPEEQPQHKKAQPDTTDHGTDEQPQEQPQQPEN
jgi:predicted small lipoprotein YifL